MDGHALSEETLDKLEGTLDPDEAALEHLLFQLFRPVNNLLICRLVAPSELLDPFLNDWPLQPVEDDVFPDERGHEDLDHQIECHHTSLVATH